MLSVLRLVVLVICTVNALAQTVTVRLADTTVVNIPPTDSASVDDAVLESAFSIYRSLRPSEVSAFADASYSAYTASFWSYAAAGHTASW